MNHRKRAVRRPTIEMKDAEALVRALKTHQVDGIVGERHIMVCRLKQAEQELENSRDQLRALAGRLQFLRENERAEIAREIHDEFGQSLTSLQLGLSWMARSAKWGQQPLQKKVKSLSGLVTSMIRSVKRIATALRPGALDELGLVKTLQSEAREFEGLTGIRCRFETNLARAKFGRLGNVAVFRIVQAALTNVARHAAASSTRVTLMKQDRDLVLTVYDNGKGISRKQSSGHDSLGIIGMRERALALDGTLALTGSRNEGTTLQVRLPLSRVLVSRAGQRSAGRS